MEDITLRCLSLPVSFELGVFEGSFDLRDGGITTRHTYQEHLIIDGSSQMEVQPNFLH